MFNGLETPVTDETETPVISPVDVLPESDPFGDGAMSQKEMERLSQLSEICATVHDSYQRAKMARTSQEKIWLDSYRMWRGEYTPEERQAIERAKERNIQSSDVFIKITKTKATAALGQITEILFAGDKLPLGVEATPEPLGVADEAYIVPEEVPIGDIYGYEGDGTSLEPGATSQTLLGGLYEKYKGLIGSKKVVEGPSPDAKAFPQINPAQEAAKNMETVILDQLEEGGFRHALRSAAWECVVLGTGCIKGPLTYTDTIHSWKKDDEGKIVYDPILEDTPRSFFVSVWNLFPDPDARTTEECSFMVEKHLMPRNKIANLKRFKGFDSAAIDRVLRNKPTREQEYWETIIRDVDTSFSDERYEVLEYWGFLEKRHIENLPSVLKSELESIVDQAEVNVWICGNEVLRVVINPFVPSRIPYYIVPYEEHKYQLWGISIPENMKDPQMLMNGHYRMMLDNLRLAGNTMLEVNSTKLVPGQDMAFYPGKIFYTQGGAPNQSIYSINVNNTAGAHIQAFDKARQLADEATGQPSYSYGQTGVSGQTRTAAGMSMLMSAAAGNIKQVIKNFDEHLLSPIGNAYFAWNMQFNEKADVRGDLKIVARGTAALMQREVQSQRLLTYLQIVSGNPLLTPFANIEYTLKQIAISLDIDPDKAVNDPTMAKLVADIMGSLNPAAQQGQPAPQQPMEGQPAPPGANPADTTGAGGANIGVGGAPQPGTEQFAG